MTKNLINLDFSTVDELEDILDEMDMEQELETQLHKNVKERKGRPNNREKKSIDRTTLKNVEID